MRALLLLSAILLISFSSLAHAATITVNPDGTGDHPTIAAAIAAASGGDIILLEPGTYTGSGNNQVTIAKNITLTSSAGAYATIVDCENNFGFIVTNAGSGATISCITIRRSLSNGIRSMDSGTVVTVEDNIFEDSNGISLQIFNSPSATVRRNVFRRNTISSSTSACLLIVATSGVVEDNVFRDNDSAFGGGLDAEGFGAGHTLLIQNNIFCGNSATWGGAIIILSVAAGASVTLQNNTLVENSAVDKGSIYIANISGSLNVNNTIIANAPSGGGVFAGSAGGTVFTCCDIYGNVGANGDNLVGVADGGDNISLDPMFVGAPGSCDVRLQPGSPCAAANSPCGTRIGADLSFGAWYFDVVYPDNGGVAPGNRSGATGDWITVAVDAKNVLGNTVDDYTGSVILSAKGASAGAEVDWGLTSGAGVFADGGPGDATATYTFDPSDNGGVEFQVRDDSQDFIDPEIVDSVDPTVADDDSEEYLVYTQSGNIMEGAGDVNNIEFGVGLTPFSTSTPTPSWLALFSYVRGASGGFLVDPTVTVLPYKDTSLLGVAPPPNFKLLHDATALEAPYPYANGYDVSVPGYPPSPPPTIAIVGQTFDDAVLSEAEEGNVQLHHWNGASWDILSATVVPSANLIWANVTGLSQLSPFFITQPLDENIYAAGVDVEPDTLNIAGSYGWLYGYVELDSLDVSDIDVSTITLNPIDIVFSPDSTLGGGVARADTSYMVIGDHDNDTKPDAEMRFARDIVTSMLQGADPTETIMIRGFLTDGFTFFRGSMELTIVDEPSSAATEGRAGFALYQNYPNPFNPSTTVRYSLKTREHVRIAVYNVRGSLVRVLVDEERPAGFQTLEWRGRDLHGQPVASGVYFIKMTTADRRLVKKAVLLK